MTEVIRVDRQEPNPADIARAAECLRTGGLVAFPTETVYGLGVHALDRAAVLRLFDVKGRPANDPLILHVATSDQVRTVVTSPPPVWERLADRFWPGPLTLVMRRGSIVPPEVTAGLDTVAVRVPAHPVARALLAAAQVPVAAPSANLFSRPSPTRAAHVLEDLAGRIEMILDSGPTDVGIESTVLDLTVEPPTVLRPGAVSLDMLREILADVHVRAHAATVEEKAMRSPGLLPTHYAPRAPLTLYQGPADSLLAAMIAAARAAIAGDMRVGVLATSDEVVLWRELPVRIAELGPRDRNERVAQRLYDALRELDAAGVDLILAHDVLVQDGLSDAIRDRLLRAAARLAFVD